MIESRRIAVDPAVTIKPPFGSQPHRVVDLRQHAIERGVDLATAAPQLSADAARRAAVKPLP
jgi:hypothetical protein